MCSHDERYQWFAQKEVVCPPSRNKELTWLEWKATGGEYILYINDRPNILLVQIDVKILMILIINISNSNNLNKFWLGIFTGQGHVNQVF